MPESSALPLQVNEALARGWVVLTANQRAARTLRRGFEKQQRAAGLSSWAPPQVLAWESWLAALHRDLVVKGRTSELLLNGAQEHTLWRAVVGEAASTATLRPVDSLAEIAAGAWNLLHAYRGRSRLKGYAGNSDTKVFLEWVLDFERRLKRGQYITAAQLPERLREKTIAREIELPPGVLLVGFDAMTAAQEALLEALRATGVSTDFPGESSTAARLQLVAAGSEQDELRACAGWVRRTLERNPEARVAVIVPEIEQLRAEIDREFRQVLAPELNDIASADAPPYEFSLGVPLARTAMVATAMDVLRWSQGALPLERISSLLLSRYFAVTEADERLARAEFDGFELRRQKLLQPRLSVDRLQRLVAGWRRTGEIAALVSVLCGLRAAFGAPELPLLRSHADWVETISEMLTVAGWAPAAGLDSAEFQTRRKWESALDELATLDFDDRPVPFSRALDSLEHILQQTLFAPESRHAPVQVMGPLESAGSTFDAVWFLRANDVEWSGLSSPNPLLPWALQRDLGMPGAVPARDAEVARVTAERISASADEVVFSYARESADGPQRPSPALGILELERIDACAMLAPADESAAMELEAVWSELPIPAPPPMVVPGGASVLEKQAACGFRAFAETRLLSSSLEDAVLGFDTRERGSIVHRALQLFWQTVVSQANLLAMPTSERDSVLDQCIAEALRDPRRPVEPGWSSAYVDAEHQRLRNLLRPWLEYEATQRSPFVVKALEDEHKDITVGPLHLRVKVDRVDTWLKGGEPAGEIIVDYKTGKAEPAQWEGDRPDAPQLPLYAVVAETSNLVGVAFASVRPGKEREMRGFAAETKVLPRGSVKDLEAQVEQWREIVTSLAAEFHAGNAEVRPKQYPDTCRYCEQRLLCRLNPAELDAAETGDDEALSEETSG